MSAPACQALFSIPMRGGGADIDFDVCATLAMCAVVKNYVGHHTSEEIYALECQLS